MTVTEVIIFCGTVGWIVAQGVFSYIFAYYRAGSGFNFLRPDIIYHNTKLNYFGVGVVCLVLNLFFLPLALCYWFYKICTVGRR